METADILTMILFGLIVAACWVVVPGLITGWLLRESGRSFWWGFVLGAVCGAVGVLAAVVFVSVADRRGGRGDGRRRSARTHYEVPVFGRLHASTAWTLAGLATFMCVWVLGGIGYEVFYRFPRNDEAHSAPGDARGVDAPTAANGGGARAVGDNSSAERAADSSAPRDDAGTQGRPSVLGALGAQPTRGNQLSTSASPVVAPPAASLEGVELTGAAPLLQPSALTAHASANANATSDAATPPPAKPAAPSRAAIISELTSSLAARGYRAHAAVSGDARTSTLSISCATLSRAAGNQLLGNSRTREALRASGIRIVVIINGQESWTYML